MKKLTVILLLTLCCLCRAQSYADEEVVTIVQSAHQIKTIDLSPDFKYALTSDGRTIALWDIGKRRIIKMLMMANRDVCFHPKDISWILVDTNVSSFLESGDTIYYIYDIYSGQRLGVKKKKDIVGKNKWMDKVHLEYNNGVITMFSRKSGSVIGVLGEQISLTAGNIALNYNDGFLVQSGIRPCVWDLKKAKFLKMIPYIDFLKSDQNLYFRDDNTVPMPKSDQYNIKHNYFHYGWRDYYECDFTRKDEILLGGFNSNITRWNIDGKLLERIRTNGAPVFSFADNGKYRVAATFKGLNMGRMSNGELKDCEAFNNDSHYKLLYHISPIFRKKYFVTGGDDGNVLMGKLGDPAYRKNMLKVNNPLMCFDVDDAERTILLSGELGVLQEILIDNPQQKFMYNTSAFKKFRVDCCLYLDNERISAGCSNGSIGFWKRGMSEPQQIIHAHQYAVTGLKLSHNRKWIVSADQGGIIRIWDANDLSPIVHIYHLGDGSDYVFITPDNYYKASKGAYDKIYFRQGVQSLGFEQFDVVYNRPDIVLRRLGQPEDITRPYYLAWKKRLHKIGYTEEMLSGEFHVPELLIVNKGKIPITTTQRKISLDIKAEDSKYRLSRLFVALNGVPLYGKGGKNISDIPTSIYEETINVKLCRGNNRIDVSCMNEKGVESYRKQIEVFLDEEYVKPNIYIASVGVSHYAQSGFDLNYAAKDATDFVDMMRQVSNDRYSSFSSMLLTDESFSNDSISNIKKFFGQAKRDDVVILFYAGHGVLNRDMDYFLGTHDMDFDVPQVNGVDYDSFESCLESTESVYRFCFVDACHSGELDKDELMLDKEETKSVGKLLFRNAGYGLRQNLGYGMKQVRELLDELFVDVRFGIGATVLSSAGGMEVALEGNDWENGLFTWCLKNGILKRAADLNSDGKISTGELIKYVSQEVNYLSTGVQTPMARHENKQQEIVIVE